VHDKLIKSFDMRESSLDGDQDLTMFMREVEEVVREIMEDSRFKGQQHYRFEMKLDECDGQRLFGGEANEGVAFQIGQIRSTPCLYHVQTLFIPYINLLFHGCTLTLK